MFLMFNCLLARVDFMETKQLCLVSLSTGSITNRYFTTSNSNMTHLCNQVIELRNYYRGSSRNRKLVTKLHFQFQATLNKLCKVARISFAI